MSEKSIRWKQAVARAREIVAVKKYNQMEVAALAMDVCDIVWGGGGTASAFTLKRFGKEIGVNPRTLSSWVAVKKMVYDKLPPEHAKKASFTKLTVTANRVDRDTTPHEVLAAFQDTQRLSDMERRLRAYVTDLRSLTYNFESRNANEHVSKELKEEILFYCKILTQIIRLAAKDLKPVNHNLASTSSAGVGRQFSMMAALGVERGTRGRIKMVDEAGFTVLLTPKDRDVVQYLKANPRRFHSPTDIGMKLKGHNRSSASAWAYRTLNKFNGSKLIIRNAKGHYKWTGKK